MHSRTATIAAADGLELFTYVWEPEGSPKAVVQIAHGMAEHAARYERFAQALTDAGYAVYANDHRGHGRTVGDPDKQGYWTDTDGFATVVKDTRAVTEVIHADHPGLPVFLFGHSMGSFISRAYAMSYGRDLAGLVLSGTAADAGLLGKVGAGVAAAQSRLRGRRHTSGLMDKLSFGQFNAAFKPNRTAYDWLSRDEAEVDAYVADPYCGAVFTAGFFQDLLSGIAYISQDANVRKIPQNLPIYLFSGSLDPVGGNTAGVTKVASQLRAAEIDDVVLRFYTDGRHEMLNETNRDQVMADVVSWLDRHLPAGRD